MAELNMPAKNGKRKVQAPRIDLTPMVDLGFLLITFFMFTTTMAREKVMDIRMPDNEPTQVPTVFIAESTITLIPDKNHTVRYYEGALTGPGDLKTTTAANILPVLLKKKNEVAALPASFSTEAHKIHVLIKPTTDSKYEDVVQMMDDMLITDVTYYALTDLTEDELQTLKK